MDRDDPTPAGVTREMWRWFPAWVNALIIVFVSVAALAVAGHYLGWWLSAQDATHQAQNTQNGYANQSTLRQQVTSQLAQVDAITTQIAEAGSDGGLAAALKVQRMAIAGTVCSDAAQVTGTPLPPQQAQWVSANCTAGNVSPSSTYYQAGQP